MSTQAMATQPEPPLEASKRRANKTEEFKILQSLSDTKILTMGQQIQISGNGHLKIQVVNFDRVMARRFRN